MIFDVRAKIDQIKRKKTKKKGIHKKSQLFRRLFCGG